MQRQLRKAGVADLPAPWDAFVTLVEQTYRETARDRDLNDHAVRTASAEMTALTVDLRRNEQLFRSLARCSPTGIIYTDTSGRCLYANKRAQELTGRTEAELLGLGYLDGVAAEDRSGLQSAVRFSQLGSRDTAFEHRVFRPDGTTIWVSTGVAAIDGEGDVGLVATVEDITERREYETKLARLSQIDGLTGLPNRLALSDDMLARLAARRPSDAVAVAIIDLDGFKLVNDSFGHNTGDRLLQLVSDRLKACVHAGDLVARLGGDEFAVVATLPSGRADAVEGLACLLSEALHGMVSVEDRVVHLGASIGVAVADLTHRTPEQLLRDADTAMYRAKRSDNTHFAVFDRKFREEVTNRYRLESELRAAVANNMIALAFQPIVDAKANRIVGTEALARWDSATLGQVPPDEFIPVAEDLGLMRQLGSDILRDACKQLAQWKQLGLCQSPFTMSVNVSTGQLADPRLPDLVAAALDQYGLHPSELVLEITESTVMRDFPAAAVSLNVLRQFGVAIAIDDFGTGYSSLAYLDRLPVDYLKIDRSFVQSLAGRGEDGPSGRLTEAIVDLAHRFGLVSVAEGVETEWQRDMLASVGCVLIQGYLIARPLRGDDPQLHRVLARDHVPQL